MNEQELIAAQAVKDFLSEELDEFDYFKNRKIVETEISGDKIYVTAEVRNTSLYFKVKPGPDPATDPEEYKISIDTTGDDSYMETKTFDWTIKYFWMALLGWDKV